MSRNSLLVPGMISENEITATSVDPTTIFFVNKYSIISPSWPV